MLHARQGVVRHEPPIIDLGPPADLCEQVGDLAFKGTGPKPHDVESDQHQLAVIAELIRRSRASVIVYAATPAILHVLQNPFVTDAMETFFGQHSSGRVSVFTDDTRYREQLIHDGAAVDTSRIDIYPLPPPHQSRCFFQGAVLADTERPSYWHLSTQDPHSLGTFEFQSSSPGRGKSLTHVLNRALEEAKELALTHA